MRVKNLVEVAQLVLGYKKKSEIMKLVSSLAKHKPDVTFGTVAISYYAEARLFLNFIRPAEEMKRIKEGSQIFYVSPGLSRCRLNEKSIFLYFDGAKPESKECILFINRDAKLIKVVIQELDYIMSHQFTDLRQVLKNVVNYNMPIKEATLIYTLEKGGE